MWIIAAILFLGASSAPGAETLDVLEVAAEEARRGPQWVQADSQGRVTLLDGEGLTERSFRNGKFGDPNDLKETALVAGVVRSAARSRSGDGWLLYAPPGGLRYFRSDEEQRLPRPDWVVTSVGLHDDRPVLSVKPINPGRLRSPGFREPDTAPLILGLSGDEWETVLERRDLVDDEVHLDSAMLFATDSKRNLWAAHRYRYRVYQLSPAGKLRFTLEVEGGKPALDQSTDKERAAAMEALKEQARASGMSLKDAVVTPVMQKPTINGLTVGRDGNIYLFLPQASEGSPALDRYNPYTNTLERLSLRLDYRGGVRMAAAREGLIVAGYSVSTGIWMLPWERLEAAKWEPVEDATGDGLPLSQEQELTSQRLSEAAKGGG